MLYSDAANWDFDWLNILYATAGVSSPFYVLSITDLLEEEQAQSFYELKAKLADSEGFRQHRAGEDVKMIYQAYIQVVKD